MTMIPPEELDTRAHVQRAVVGGDAASLEILIARLSPLLLAQARLRIGPALRRVIEPEDLVQEVWAIALPRLPELGRRPGSAGERCASGAFRSAELEPAELEPGILVAFLARTLTYRCNDLVRKYIAGKPRAHGSSVGMLARLPGDQSGAVTRAVRRETDDIVRAAIDRLDELDRQVVVMRGIERHAHAQIAAVTGLTANTVAARYRRALHKLSELLPAEIAALFAVAT